MPVGARFNDDDALDAFERGWFRPVARLKGNVWKLQTLQTSEDGSAQPCTTPSPMARAIQPGSAARAEVSAFYSERGRVRRSDTSDLPACVGPIQASARTAVPVSSPSK